MKTTTIPAAKIIAEGLNCGVLDSGDVDHVRAYTATTAAGPLLDELVGAGVIDTEALLRLAGFDAEDIASAVDRFELDIVGEDLVLTERED